MSSDAPRYAIYFAPEPDDPWWTFGIQWLGSDPITGVRVPRFPVVGVPEDVCERITEAPRFYGLHATLKPPFALADGCTESELIASARNFCRQRAEFALKGLAVRDLGDFIALRPVESSAEIDALAADCVRAFDPLRQPLDAEEVRRRASGLDPRQLELLRAWGYPYIFDQFRFHVSLTGALDAGLRERVIAALSARASAGGAPFADRQVPVTGVCLFSQPTRTAPFRLRWRVRWGGVVEGMSAPAS